MGVPSSEVGYTIATTRRETTKVHKNMWWHWGGGKIMTCDNSPTAWEGGEIGKIKEIFVHPRNTNVGTTPTRQSILYIQPPC